MVSKLARLSAAERRQIIDDFTAEVFQGLEPNPGHAARWGAGPNLPDDPSPEQVDAWVELAELVANPEFRQRIRLVAGHGVQVQAGQGPDIGWAQENAGAAALRGVLPDSGGAAQVVDRILAPTAGSQHRAELLAQLEVISNPRIERYWQLTAIINGWPPFPTPMPAFEWLLAALRTHE